MFVDKYKPVFAPEVEGGTSEPDTGGAPPPSETTERNDGPGSGRSELRKSLERGFEDARKREASEASPRERQVKKPDRVGQRLQERDATQAAEVTDEPEQAEGTEEATATQTAATPVGNAPEGWSPEAKQAWAETPPTVQAAVLKREQDIQRGVASLKQKYQGIDKALAPHLQNIQQLGHSPASAVNQLFSWFDALGKNPAVAFPALANSFGYDISQFVRQQPAQAAQAAPASTAEGQPTPQGTLPPELQQYLHSHLGPLYQGLQHQQQVLQQQQTAWEAQNQAKTEENLSIWAQGKPYYEEVRERMAHLIGSGAIPLKNGKVDLNAAYEEAVWGLPHVRAKVFAWQKQQAAEATKKKQEVERKAQAEQAAKARRAAGSVPISAPGTPSAPGQSKLPKKSVRENLMDAIAAHKE